MKVNVDKLFVSSMSFNPVWSFFHLLFDKKLITNKLEPLTFLYLISKRVKSTKIINKKHERKQITCFGNL